MGEIASGIGGGGVVYVISENAAHVKPPPTSAPNASSGCVWRPISVLAHHTRGKTDAESAPHAPETYRRHMQAPVTPPVCSESLRSGVRIAKAVVARA